MGVKLTDKVCKEAASPNAGAVAIYDSEMPGFGLRTTAAGVKAFVLRYRVKSSGDERSFTIGKYPAWSVLAARKEAALLRQRIDRGGDPRGEAKKERGEPTVKELAKRYVEEWLPRKRASGRKRDKEMLEADILPALGKLKVRSVSYADIYDLHRKVTKRGAPIRANRVLSCASKMFALAVVPWGYRADNPCRGIERNPENQRERFLSPDEIGRLVFALKAYPPPRRRRPRESDAEQRETVVQGRHAANCVLFLMLTGARSSEAMGAIWRQFDLTAGTWTKQASTVKQDKLHHVPLNGPARQLLASIGPKAALPGDFVFPGRKKGQPLKQVRSCWGSVTKAAGISDAKPHDLRHTYASLLASGGSSLALIGRMLGHSSPRTTARYAHFFTDPLREAAERVGAVVMPEGEGAEVVKLVGNR
jgi:integrase